MPNYSITTNTPQLPLTGLSVFNPDIPDSLPINTAISCSVTANGSGLDGEPISITLPTQTVTVSDITSTIPQFIDSSFSINLNADGSGEASVTAVGDYATVEWSVEENSGGGEGGESPFPEVGAGEVTDWRPISELRSLIPTTENQTLTIPAGVGYYMTTTDKASLTFPENTTIQGGHITAAQPLVWTPVSGEIDLYEANIPSDLADPFTTNSSALKPLMDQYSKEIPQQAAWPTNTDEQWKWDIAPNPNHWIDVRSGGENGEPIGDVLTTRGDNEVYQDYTSDFPIVTGLRFYEGTMVRNEITSLFERVDPTKLNLILQSDANVVGDFIITDWDPTTGVLLAETTFKNPGYAKFVLIGAKEFIANRPGRYSIDYNENKIYYKPKNPSKFEGFISVADNIINNNSNTNQINLNDMTLSGSHATSSSPATLYGPTKARRCFFHSGCVVHRGGKYDFEYNLIYYYNTRGLAGTGPGCRVVKNKFIGLARHSAVGGGAPTTGEFDPVIIEGNYFSLRESNHGQGTSLYGDIWQNAILRHNIFHNCQRSLAFQPHTQSEDRNPDERGVFLVENNLIVYDDYVIPGVGSGQSTASFNCCDDDHLKPASGEQKVYIRNNTMVINYDNLEPFIDPSDVAKWSYFDIGNIRYSNVVVSNNLLGAINANFIRDTDDNDRLLHKRLNNMLLNKTNIPGTAYGATDLATPDDWKSVFDYSRYAAIGDALTGASDGGKIGIRWSGGDLPSDLESLPVNWADIYTQEPIPQITEADTTDTVSSGQDLRPAGTATLVQHALINFGSPENTQTTFIEDEEVFQWNLPTRGEVSVDSNNIITDLFFWHGSKTLDYGATQKNLSGRVEYWFEDTSRMSEFAGDYEIRFIYTDALGNSTEELTFAPRIETQSISYDSYGHDIKYVKLSRSQSDSIGSPDGAFKWEDGCSIEYFVYKIDPF